MCFFKVKLLKGTLVLAGTKIYLSYFSEKAKPDF